MLFNFHLLLSNWYLKKKYKLLLQVFDKNGTDVTPHPLYSAKVTAAEARHKFARFLDEISVGSTSEMSKDSVCSMPFSQWALQLVPLPDPSS